MAKQTEQVTLRIEGPAFEDFYPAEPVSVLVTDVERLLRDCSGQVLRTRNRAVRPKIRVLANFPRRGSYVQDYRVLFEAGKALADSVLPVLPLIPDVVEMLGNLSKWLKMLLPQFENSDQKPVVSANDIYGPVTVNQNHYDISGGTFIMLGGVAGEFTRIASKMGKEITRVNLDSEDGSSFSMGLDDAELLGSTRSRRAARKLKEAADELRKAAEAEEQEVVSATVDILSFNKERRTGKLRVISSDQLPLRTFGFELDSRPETDAAIKGMLESRVRVFLKLLSPRKLLLVSVQV